MLRFKEFTLSSVHLTRLVDLLGIVVAPLNNLPAELKEGDAGSSSSSSSSGGGVSSNIIIISISSNSSSCKQQPDFFPVAGSLRSLRSLRSQSLTRLATAEATHVATF